MKSKPSSSQSSKSSSSSRTTQSTDDQTQGKNRDQLNQQDQQFAVVTGASSGIGYELAKQFAENGFDLLICAEDAGIHEAAERLQRLEVNVEALQVDLSHPDGVEKLYDKISQSSGRPLDAIAINAGVGVGGDFARETDLAAEINLINLNVTSSVHLAKLVLQDMVERNEGKILFTSSIAATMPGTYEAVYAGSKAFLQSFAAAIRNELKDTNITITSLMPGPTETNFFHRAGMDDTKVGADPKDDAATVAEQGFKALMSGQDHVVAGSLKNKVFAAAGKLMPETATAEMHRHLSEPGSAHKP